MLFVHGNVSSSLFWQPAMLALPEPYRPLAMDLRGFGGTDPEPVDATRGVRDYADDLAAVIAALGLDAVHLVGWSMGGGVVLQYLADRPGSHRVASLTLVDPVSPFGFGGTRGVDGTLCDPSGAGSGGGTANQDFIARLAAGDRSGASPLSPRQVLLAHYVKPPHVPEQLDIFVESMLSTRLGDDHYPGHRAHRRGLAGHCPGRPRRAQHDGAHPLPDRRPVRRAAQAAGPVAARRRTTSSSRTPPCTTWPTGARSARCRAGRGRRRGRRSPWWPRPAPSSTATRRPAAATARSSSRTPATVPTWTSPRRFQAELTAHLGEASSYMTG